MLPKLRLWLILLLVMSGTAIAQERPIEPVEVKVMTFNIWLGGELVDFGKVVEAIQAADADIVGLQEPTGNTRKLAEALGWQYYNEQMHIISRYPLIDPTENANDYIYAQIVPGQVIALANVHLTSNPYGPYSVRDGETVEAVIEQENGLRLPEIELTLSQLEALVGEGVPVFLTGDLNAPSHRDWTEAVMATRPEMRYPVEWSVSLAVEDAGFVDTFRAVHPDPVENPGITWTYGYPYPRLNEGEVIDRIDFVYVANAVEVLDSQILGEPTMPNTDIAVVPYPADHRGVVSTVRVLPVVPPSFVSVNARVVTQGEQIVARYHALGGEATDRIVLVKSGGDAASEALVWLPPMEAGFFGAVPFATNTLAAGKYDVVLLGENDAEVARTSFNVLTADMFPTIRADKDTFAQGEAIAVSWENTPAMLRDWVGIYATGDPDVYNNYLAFLYTNASVDGSTLFDTSVLGDEMLPLGDYEVRLMRDDGYEIMASAAFKVE